MSAAQDGKCRICMDVFCRRRGAWSCIWSFQKSFSVMPSVFVVLLHCTLMHTLSLCRSSCILPCNSQCHFYDTLFPACHLIFMQALEKRAGQGRALPRQGQLGRYTRTTRCPCCMSFFFQYLLETKAQKFSTLWHLYMHNLAPLCLSRTLRF